MQIPDSLLGKTVYIYYADGVRGKGVVTKTKDGYELDISPRKRKFSPDDVREAAANRIELSFSSPFRSDKK